MSPLTVCAAGIVASVLALILKKNNAEYSFILTVSASAMIIMYIAGALIEAVSGVKDLFASSNMSVTYLTLLLKCVGICFLTEFTCDTCKDAGQAALADIVLFSGRIFVLVSALPLFSELLNIVTELSGG
ncbi:MAG: hypothetical protein IJW04_04990 [Ruminococcus sp.]|nr:hypothetical protein [Ruminococcus sp.]